jgi:S1-C subfamily serine protease
MRIVTLLLVAAALPASAQVSVFRAPNGGVISNTFGSAFNDGARVAIGVTTTSSATRRDTLGVLVTSVREGSPADKAGIGEGDRIASINGVSLKLAAADIDEYEMGGAMSRRLSRELNKLKAGDDVELRLYTNGQNKTLRVKAASPDDIYESPARRRQTDRATLGISVGTSGSSRDTLGVFVMGVEDGGPAAKAGIEEGSRIASINGVDVRGRRDMDEDGDMLRTSNVSRLTREIAKLNAGDEAELRVFYNGQYKNVKVKSVRAGDLPRRGRAITVIGGDGFIDAMPAIATRVPIDIGRTISSELGRAFSRAGISNRVVW